MTELEIFTSPLSRLVFMLSIANSLASTSLMLATAYLGWKFWQNLRAGKNGPTGMLMAEKLAMSNLFLRMAVNSFAWAYPDLFLRHAEIMQLWLLASLLILIAIIILQQIEFRNVDH